MEMWLLVSNATIIGFRTLHFYSQFIGEPENENMVAPNWDKVYYLRKLSYINILAVYPIYFLVTIIGTHWFVESTKYSNCVRFLFIFQLADTEQYSFLIFWLIINMIILLSYGILLMSLKIAQRNGNIMTKNILLLLRRMDIHEVDNELFDNAKQNLEEENSKRIDLIFNLNEFGIYLMMRGLTSQEYVKFPT